MASTEMVKAGKLWFIPNLLIYNSFQELLFYRLSIYVCAQMCVTYIFMKNL